MKKILTILFLALFAFESFAQTENTLQKQQELMKKSDAQNKAGWIFFGSGLALSLVARAIPIKVDAKNDNSGIKSVLGWTGILSIGTSIPLFLSSGRNARRAADLSLEAQTLHQPIMGNELPRNFPSISLKIPL